MADENLLVSLASGLATGLGGVLALAAGRAGAAVIPALLGISAGIGFTVVFFDMLPEAVRSGPWTAWAGGLAAGLAFGRLAQLAFPHLKIARPRRLRGRPAGSGDLFRTGCLFALGVAMHNLPEGLAVGAGLEAGPGLGMLLATAIGLHNIPEGMALTGVLALAGAGPGLALFAALGAGLMLPLGTVLAGVWVAAFPGVFSFILSLGAGVLLYITASELVPESYRMNPALARTGMAAGGALSLALSLAL